MRRGMVIGLVLLLVLVGIGIGVGAYNAGLSEGLEQTGRAGEVVRDHDGFFPFGLFLFPLLFFGVFFLLRGLFWGGHGHGPWGHWGPGGPPAMEEWHRRQHGPGDRPEGESATA